MNVGQVGRLSPGVAGIATGPAWARPFQFAADFRSGFVRLGGRRVSMQTIDSLYHSRASARRAEDSAGVSREFANGVMALTDRGHDSREGWTALNFNPLSPRTWAVTGANASDEPGTFLGFTSARRVASGGGTWHRLEATITGGLANATSYSVRMLYAAGSSGRCRVVVRNSSVNAESIVSGPVGSVATLSTTIGSWSSIVNVDRGGGVFELSATFTASVDGAIATIGVGPDSATAGQDVIVIAAQITQTAYTVPFGVGTVAPDSLVIPAADAGLAVNPATTGLTMVWRGRDFESATGFPRMMEARLDTGNRVSFLRNQSTGVAGLEPWSGGVGGGGPSTTLANAPRATDTTLMMTWRPDGTGWGKIGTRPAGTFSRGIFTGLSAIGIGNAGNSVDRINAQTRLAAIGAFALSDADALNLFNQVSAA